MDRDRLRVALAHPPFGFLLRRRAKMVVMVRQVRRQRIRGYKRLSFIGLAPDLPSIL